MCSSPNISHQKGMLFFSAWNGFLLSTWKLLLSLLDPNQRPKSESKSKTSVKPWQITSQKELSISLLVMSMVCAVESLVWCQPYFLAAFVYQSHSFIRLHIPCWQGQQISLGISVPGNVPYHNARTGKILIKQTLQSLMQMSALQWSCLIRLYCSSLYDKTYHSLKTHSSHVQSPE